LQSPLDILNHNRPFVYDCVVVRRRTVSDEVLLDAALLIVRESGPDALSFGALARRVSLAGSTLVQRFGSKANLLRSALMLAWDRLDADTARALDRAGDGASGVVDLLVMLSGQYEADTFADQLLILREDLRDPVLRARGQAWLAVLTEAIEQRLADVPGGATGLGELVIAQWQGVLTVWGFQRRGAIGSQVRRSLTELLDRLVPSPGDPDRPG
jgi:AcrR family transcriptional regulator